MDTYALMVAIRERSTASGTTLAVLMTMAVAADEHGVCWPSQAYLADGCHVGVRAVERAIDALIAAGDISVFGRLMNGRNLYWVHPGGRTDGSAPDIRNYRLQNRADKGGDGDVPDMPEHPSEMTGGGAEHPSKMTGADDLSTRQKRRVAPVENDGSHPSKMTGALYTDEPPLKDQLTTKRARGDDVGLGDGRDGVAAKARRLAPQCERMMDVLGIDPAKDWKGPQKVRDLIFEFDAEGADFDRDVWPVVDRIMAAQRRKGGSVTTPGYFRAAVMDAIAARAASEGAALVAPADPLASLAGTRRYGRMVKIASFIAGGTKSWPDMWGKAPSEAEMEECRALYAASGQSLGSDMRGAA